MKFETLQNRHFFIVGAQRSGSTYLYELLSEHPEIEMNQPSVPEPKFFLAEGSEFRKNEYLQRFFPDCQTPIRGEKSTSYLEVKDAARRISIAFPDATIVVILRNPIERAISNYWFSVQNKFETLSIDQALLADLAQERQYKGNLSVSPYRYLKRGRYIEYLEVYAHFFALKQLQILVFEDFVNNRLAVSNLYQALGVRGDFHPPSLSSVVNKGQSTRSVI